MLRFQTDPGDAAAAADPYDAALSDATPSATPADPAATEAATPAAESWQGPPQEDWQRVTQFMEQSGPTLQMLSQILAEEEGGGEAQQAPTLDPNDPNSVQAYLDNRVEALFNERVAPFQPLLGQIAEREGETAARGRLDELAGTVGDFDRDQALVAAQAFLGQGLQPDQALQAAAQHQYKFETELRAAAVKEYTDKLQAAATAPQVPGAVGSATENSQTPTGRDRYESAFQNWHSSQHPVVPTG